MDSGAFIAPESQSLLADLLHRRCVVRKRGREPRPSYERTLEESRFAPGVLGRVDCDAALSVVATIAAADVVGGIVPGITPVFRALVVS